MNPPKAETKNEKEQRRREDNAKKAKTTADQKFPSEKWKKLEENIYLSPRKKIGEGTSFVEEKRDAQILKKFGSTTYLVPESSREPGKKYDAIVNGQMMEFKNMCGNSEKTLKKHFFAVSQTSPKCFY
ncbi:hypothetical protein AGMMS50230_04260 [Spirochaetia bacterium]|nr:hypothetical protein AGMMS50230_04260 [Spirochaetia bacterium]